MYGKCFYCRNTGHIMLKCPQKLLQAAATVKTIRTGPMNDENREDEEVGKEFP